MRAYRNVIATIHAARLGARAALNLLVAQLHRAGAAPPEIFSSGLHAATLCADFPFPWGSATAPAKRKLLLERRVARLTRDDVWPFVPATAAHDGFVETCLNWPATAAPPAPPADSTLPAVPTLLVNGDRDLSTPLAWAREEAHRAPRGTLVVVHGASHSVQNYETGDTGRAAIEAFLHR